MFATLVILAALMPAHGAKPCPPPKFVAEPCVKTKTCIPNKHDYSAVTTVAPGVSFAPSTNRLNCTVSFALCAWANCKIIPDSNPPVAECGCVSGKQFAPWSVTVAAAIPNQKIKEQVLAECYPHGFTGPNTCAQNKDPFCAAVAGATYLNGKWDTMSTFTPTAFESSLSCTGPGLVAVCDAAACYNKPSWDGNPVTCYCTYYNVPTGVAYDIDGYVGGANVTCSPPKGYVHSGIVPISSRKL